MENCLQQVAPLPSPSEGHVEVHVVVLGQILHLGIFNGASSDHIEKLRQDPEQVLSLSFHNIFSCWRNILRNIFLRLV